MPSEKGTGIVIATVRIAPVERWCEEVLEVFAENPSMARLVGTPIEIEVGRVFPETCNGKPSRRWMTTHKTNLALKQIVGETADPMDGKGSFICEHMLEMD